jgi:non-specific serine/threonine protein kinase/serine/threonine-protein kinase
MTPRQWIEVDEILKNVLELPESERYACIARECEGRPELRSEVESLLRAHRAAETFLEPATHTHEGRRIGPYLLMEEIGAGGMGTVYRAQREDENFKHEVAVKLMRASLEIRPEAVRRFLDERQILAAFAHPNIARLLDGGYTPEGTPYIVMEYVAGTPITDYCVRKELDLKARLRLFLQLAAGVQSAHQHLVIHRDIKPANILVTGDGIPKLLDFGIAKLIDPQAAAADTTVRPFTPDYASPEQVRGTAMSTASDVYSLGVLLYELVAGRRPYQLAGMPLEQAMETICLKDPAEPSTVSRDVPEDLDAIVMKALRKEPESRYASVREFGEDIDRYLDFRPVVARQGTYRYVARKFVRRHRAGVATAAAACVILAASAGLVIRESRVARFERDRAQRRFNEVRHLAHSVIFDLQDKIAALPGSTPVRKDLITSAIGYVDRLAKEAAGDPGLQQELAEAYMQIGEVQGGGNENLGDQQGALASFQKAEQIARVLVAAQPSFEARKLLVETLREVGQVYDRQINDRAKAEAYRSETLAMARDLQKQYPGNEDAKILMAKSLFDIAGLTVDSQSLGYQLEALPIFEELLRAKPSDATRQRNAALIHKYIAGYWLKVDSAQALPYLERAMELDEARVAKVPGNQGAKLDLSIDYSQFGEYYEIKQDLPAAIVYQRKTLAIRRDLAASDPKDVWKQGRLAYALTSTAGLLIETHDYRGALANLAESRRISERLGIADRRTVAGYARTLFSTGDAQRAIGNEQAACEQYSKARDLYRKVGQPGSDPQTLAGLEKELASCPGR